MKLSVNCASVIESSGLKFGTSGIRGLVSQFIPEVCVALATSFVLSLKLSGKIAIVIDNRPSSPILANACIAAFDSSGIAVTYFGVLSTPALVYPSQVEGISVIMVTGSHIPFERNGFKFYKLQGELSNADESSIIYCSAQLRDFCVRDLPKVNESAGKLYMERYLDCFGYGSFNGLKIAIYYYSSAGRDLYIRLFNLLGAHVTELGRSDVLVPIETEAVSVEVKIQAKTWVSAFNLDAIFSTDGDGDRPLLADETGNYVKGDMLCLLCAKYYGIEALAFPVSVNIARERLGYFKKMLRARIGFPYVVAGMEELCCILETVAGCEANGGFFLAKDLYYKGRILNELAKRDSLLPALTVLKSPKYKECFGVSELPQRYTSSDRLRDFPTELSFRLLSQIEGSPEEFLSGLSSSFNEFSVKNFDLTDDIRLLLDDRNIIHLRASGNAPELRFYVESESDDTSAKILASCLNYLESLRKLN